VKLVLLLAWRQIAHRPGATLLSALGIAVGIATVTSVLVVDHNTLLSQQTRRIPSDPESDLLIQPLLGAPEAYDTAAAELRAAPFLRGVTGFATGTWVLDTPLKSRAGVEVMAVEPGARDYHGAYLVTEGRDLDFGNGAPELLVSSGLAVQLGLQVDDIVSLSRPPPRAAPVERCVDGQLVYVGTPRTPAARGAKVPFQVVGILAPTQLGFHNHRILTTFDQGRQLFGRDLNARFWADFDTAAMDFRGVEAALRDGFVVHAPKRALAGLAPQEAAFRSGVRLCGFLALFLGLYIIFNTMSMSLVERVRQIGLLRSLGMTRGRLLGLFLTEGAVLALLGAAGAALLAERIVAAMERLQITTLGFGKPIEITEVPWVPVLAVMGAGVLFALLGIAYPFVRASRLSVIDALRRGVIELSRDPFTGTRRTVLVGMLALVPVAWLIGAPESGFVPLPMYQAFLLAIGIVGGALALLLVFSNVLPGLAGALLSLLRGPAMVLARSTVSSARHRVFATVTGLMLVFAAVFLVVSVLESLKAETRRFADAALRDRLFVRTTPEGAERLDELRAAAPELAGLAPVNVEIHSPFLVRALDARMLRHGSLADTTAERRDFQWKPTLILSTRCADDFGYAVGDRVTLATAADGPVPFEVIAVTDEYGFAPDDRVFAVVSHEMMKRYWCLEAEALGDLFVAWAPGLDEGDARPLEVALANVIGADNLISVRHGDAVAREYVADLDRNFAIFYAILVLTVILAAVGVLNAMVIAVLERRREIGLLRAVGLTGGQVARMLLVEAGAFGVLGGLLGLVLGIPLATVSAEALTALSHMDLAFELTPRALAAVMGGAVLVALAAVLYPALRANRMRLSSVMRYE
jgi:putative ABC transport system permease protein